MLKLLGLIKKNFGEDEVTLADKIIIWDLDNTLYRITPEFADMLDEATASLDVENETAIQEALSRLIRNKTVLIIAHRMRTVSGAEQIVVLKDGAVAEQGSPAELLQSGGIFARMLKCQTESQNWTLDKA